MVKCGRKTKDGGFCKNNCRIGKNYCGSHQDPAIDGDEDGDGEGEGGGDGDGDADGQGDVTADGQGDGTAEAPAQDFNLIVQNLYHMLNTERQEFAIAKNAYMAEANRDMDHLKNEAIAAIAELQRVIETAAIRERELMAAAATSLKTVHQRVFWQAMKDTPIVARHCITEYGYRQRLHYTKVQAVTNKMWDALTHEERRTWTIMHT